MSYTINSSGMVKGAKVVYSSDRSYSKEAFKILGEAGLWKPGIKDGISSNFKCTLTVNFNAPIHIEDNLRDAKVIHKGTILPKNKIWYLADNIYLDQVKILNLQQSRALLGTGMKRPIIIIGNEEASFNYSDEIIAKLVNIDSSLYDLYINDDVVDLTFWKEAIKSNQRKMLIIDSDNHEVIKLKARLAFVDNIKR